MFDRVSAPPVEQGSADRQVVMSIGYAQGERERRFPVDGPLEAGDDAAPSERLEV